MATYRLMDGVSGRPGVGSSGTQPPAAGVTYSGNFISGLAFQVTQGNIWFQGYWSWVPTTVNSTAAQKYALWQITGSVAGTLVPNSVVTSGTLTAGAWNYTPLTTPLLLSPQFPYMAATGINGNFPETQNQFAATQPYASGITNGPLHAFASAEAGGYALHQSLYSVAGTDPSLSMPAVNDADDLLWLDVQVTDQAPTGPTYRAFPNLPSAGAPGTGATNNAVFGAYTLGMEFSLTQPCMLQKIWHFSPPGVTILPTRCGIWNVGTQIEVVNTDNSSPSWSGAAGSGWVYCNYSGAGVTLNPSVNYKVSTFYGVATGNWFAASTTFWDTGDFMANGLTSGPLVVPGNSTASPGQNSWNNSTTWTYPNTSTDPENDWIDVEVSSLTSGGSGLVMVSIV